MKKNKGAYVIEWLILTHVVSVILCVVIYTMVFPIYGLFPFGPVKTVEVKVERLYVDHSNNGSDYMVGTDKGVFECDDSYINGIFNADEIYSNLKEGKRYLLTVRGRKLTNMIWKEYPNVLAVKSIEE